MESGGSYGIVPVGYILPNQRRPSRRGILIQIIHNQDIDRLAGEGTAYPDGLKATLIADDLALVRIAGVVAAFGGCGIRVGCCLPSEECLWKQSVIGIVIDDTLEFAVEFSCLNGIIRDNRDTLVWLVA